MKNSKLVKIVFIIIVILICLLLTKETFATDAKDLNALFTGTDSNSNPNVLPISGQNASNNNGNNNVNNNVNNNGNNILKTSNKSDYNNTTLPKTGVKDSASGVVFMVVLVISAVYTYKKMEDYKNI